MKRFLKLFLLLMMYYSCSENNVLRRAKEASELGLHSYSFSILREELSSFPATKEYCQLVVTAAIKIENDDNVLWSIEKCKFHKVDVPEVAWGTLYYLRKKDNLGKAIPYFENVIKQYPQYLKIYLEGIEIFQKVGDDNKAIFYIIEAAKQTDDKQMLNNFLNKLVQFKSYAQAALIMQRLPSPNLTNIHQLLIYARIHLNINMAEKAQHFVSLANGLIKQYPSQISNRIRKDFADVFALKKEGEFDPILDNLNKNINSKIIPDIKK